jgi:hypothetical protein
MTRFLKSPYKWTVPAAAALVAGSLPASATVNLAEQFDVGEVREATGAFHNISLAQAGGYALVPGLDECFDNPGVGGMGIHYINTTLLNNLVLDPDQPQAAVYARGADGSLRLVAVEYIIPAALWDSTHTKAPRLAGMKMHLEPDLGVYVLHAWVWEFNPAGFFQDWNPRISQCVIESHH